LTIYQTFFSRYRPDAVGSSYTTVLVHGGLDDQSNPGVEVCSSQFVADLLIIEIPF